MKARQLQENILLLIHRLVDRESDDDRDDAVQGANKLQQNSKFGDGFGDVIGQNITKMLHLFSMIYIILFVPSNAEMTTTPLFCNNNNSLFKVVL